MILFFAESCFRETSRSALIHYKPSVQDFIEAEFLLFQTKANCKDVFFFFSSKFLATLVI